MGRGLRRDVRIKGGSTDRELWLTFDRNLSHSEHHAGARPWRSSSIDFRARQRQRHWYSSFTSARRWRVMVRRPAENFSDVCRTLYRLVAIMLMMIKITSQSKSQWQTQQSQQRGKRQRKPRPNIGVLISRVKYYVICLYIYFLCGDTSKD